MFGFFRNLSRFKNVYSIRLHPECVSKKSLTTGPGCLLYEEVRDENSPLMSTELQFSLLKNRKILRQTIVALMLHHLVFLYVEKRQYIDFRRPWSAPRINCCGVAARIKKRGRRLSTSLGKIDRSPPRDKYVWNCKHHLLVTSSNQITFTAQDDWYWYHQLATSI